MLFKIRQFVKRGATFVGARFRHGIKTRDAIVFSLLLHVIAAAAMASFYAGTIIVKKASPPDDVVLEFVTDTASSDIVQRTDADQGLVSSADTKTSPQKTQNNRRRLMSASLASLNELKSSFDFMKHSMPSDSTHRLGPISGTAPDIDALGNSLKYATGSGPGSGVQISIGGAGGVCVPGPGR